MFIYTISDVVGLVVFGIISIVYAIIIIADKIKSLLKSRKKEKL